MSQAYDFKREKKKNQSFTLEGAKGVKGKHLFAFFQWPLVCEIQYVLTGEKKSEIGHPDPEGKSLS